MRCLSVLAVMLASAVFAGVLAGFIGDAGAAAHGISTMEGGRAWLVLYCIAGSAAAGGIVGAVGTRLAGGMFLRGLAAALVTDLAVAAIVAAVVFLTVEQPPRINGRRVHLEFEIELPPGQPLPDGAANEIYICVAGFTNGDLIRLDLNRPAAREGRTVLAATMPIPAPLRDVQQIYLRLGEESEQAFTLNLPPQPREQDETWSAWVAPHPQPFQTPVAPDRECAVRYRMRPD